MNIFIKNIHELIPTSYYISGRVIAKSFIITIIAMYFLADFSRILWGLDNMIYVIALPIMFMLIYILLIIKFKDEFKLTFPFEWQIIVGLSIALYVIATVYGLRYTSSPHFIDWTILRSAFIVNIIFIYLAYVTVKYYPITSFKALLLACKIGVIITFVVFILYLISLKINFLPDSFISYSREGDIDRFAGLFKEPAEASFFLLFSAILLYSNGSKVYSFISLLMGYFLFSNSFWLLLIVIFPIYFIITYAKKYFSFLFFSCIIFVVVFFMIIQPDESYFLWLDLILPRASSLYLVRDTPQRLWTNWIAIQDFMQMSWPLGGGAGFIRTFGKDYYLFSIEVHYGAGAGVFKFLSDFGIIGLLLLIGGVIKLHKFIMHYNGKKLIIIAALICIIFMSLRTGYYNISVWTCFLVLTANASSSKIPRVSFLNNPVK